MEIFGVGADIIEVERIKSAIKNNLGFLTKVYTENEVDYCSKKNKGKYPSFAARFAVQIFSPFFMGVCKKSDVQRAYRLI